MLHCLVVFLSSFKWKPDHNKIRHQPNTTAAKQTNKKPAYYTRFIFVLEETSTRTLIVFTWSAVAQLSAAQLPAAADAHKLIYFLTYCHDLTAHEIGRLRFRRNILNVATKRLTFGFLHTSASDMESQWNLWEKKKYIYGLPRSDESLWWPNLSHLASCVN